MSSLIATSRELVEKKKKCLRFSFKIFTILFFMLTMNKCVREKKNENKDMKLKLDDETETRQ